MLVVDSPVGRDDSRGGCLDELFVQVGKSRRECEFEHDEWVLPFICENSAIFGDCRQFLLPDTSCRPTRPSATRDAL